MKPRSDSATDPSERELRLDRLLGRHVLAGNNQHVGRLEEFRAEQDGRDWVIMEYVIGVAGLFERLGVGVKLLFGRRGGGYVARWDQLDISDPEHPRLTCGVQELRRV
ncbi:MAG: hypothetical protein DMF84_26855 [Acidobacteria bacterium]|nr:MAG: hypothetical protein DMF84_26855 [Acidobacteriota bacterium]